MNQARDALRGLVAADVRRLQLIQLHAGHWLELRFLEGRKLRFGRAEFLKIDRGGIKNVFYSSPGTDHEWQTWRRSLHDFAPKLFRE